MDFYSPNNSQSDEAFEDFLKRKNRYIAEEEIMPRTKAYNLLSKNYFDSNFQDQSSSSYKQNVVIKIPNKGSGSKFLMNLIKYIGRELPSQEGEEKQDVLDMNGEIIEADSFKEIIDAWSKDFRSNDFEMDEKIKADFDNYLYQKETIALMKSDKDLNNDLLVLSEHINRFEAKYKQTNYLKHGDLIKDTESGKVGFYNKYDYKEPKLLSLDESNSLSVDRVNFNTIENVGKDIKQSSIKQKKDFTHIILSTGGDNPDKEDATKATLDFLKDNIESKGYDFVFARHDDTDHLHFHVIVKHTNQYEQSKPFALDKFDLQNLRESYSEHLDRYGIDRTATRQYDREDYIQSLRERADKLHDKADYWQSKLDSSKTPYFDAGGYRRRVLNELSFLGEYFEKNNMKAELKIIEEHAERFKIDSPKQADKIIEYTNNFIERDMNQIEDKYKSILKSEVNKPLHIEAEQKRFNRTVESYEQYLAKAKEDLNTLPREVLNEEIQKRQAGAIGYIEHKQSELDKFNRDIQQLNNKDRYKDADRGIERERE